MKRFTLRVALCAAFCVPAARAETAGQVLAAFGEALALRDGRIHPLRAGALIESGDQVHTGADSYLHIRFTDWGVISLRPRTDFVVDDYAYEARAGGRERAFFSLLNGGARSLTGLIGRRDRGNYRLRTTTMTIGIRGTVYSVLICKRDCRTADGRLGEDGVYGGVVEGRIAVSPYGGAALEREFGAGEYFRLENEKSIPVPLLVPPSFFWDRLEPQAWTGGRTFAGVPWTPAPGTSDPAGALAGGDLGVAALLRTDGSLTLSPIASPVLSQAGLPAVSTLSSVTAPLTSFAGSALNALVSAPIVAPTAAMLPSTAGSLANPVLAPVTSVVGSSLGAVANPVVAPAAPAISPVAPAISPVAPTTTTVAPVISPPPAASLPTLPTLPVVGSSPPLLPRK